MKTIFIYLLIFSSLSSFAQVDIINQSLTDSSLNILYIGCNNRIKILGFENDTSLRLVSSHPRTSIRKYENNVFRVGSHKIEPDTLRVYKGDSLIKMEMFDTYYLRDPIPQFGNITDTVATIKEIISNPTLSAIIPNNYYTGRKYYVISFNLFIIKSGDTTEIYNKRRIEVLTFYDNNGKKRRFLYIELNWDATPIEGRPNSTDGSKLTKKQIRAIRRLKPGDKVCIERIKTFTVGGSLRNLGSIVITIK